MQPFLRVFRVVAQDLKTDTRFQTSAVQAVHEAAEAYLVSIFEDSHICAVRSKRHTLKLMDMKLAERLRGEDDIERKE